jgi:serine/threonine protein phosphatase PrpC
MASKSPAETRLFVRQNMPAVEVHPISGGTVALLTTRSPGKETDSEDAAALIAVDEARAVLAVADGLGGHAAGAEAAALALDALVESINVMAGDGPSLRSPVLNGIEEANRRVAAMGVGAATTLAVVEINGAWIRPYHVGDSAILVVGQRGKIKLLTIAHSPVGYAVEAGVLGSEEAIHHEHRHLVSNIVGSADMRIEVGPELMLRPRDTLVLGSDGLFDNLFVSEIVEFVRKGPLLAAVTALTTAGRRRMEQPQPDHPAKADDLTVLVYRMSSPRRSQPS